MHAHQLAHGAYASSNAAIRSAGQIEYEAFSRVTHRLAAAAREEDFVGLASALHDNRRLWDLLSVQVADPANALDDSLRARLLYLAEFVREHSSKVLAQDATPDVLTEINTSIMQGLREGPAQS